MGDVGGIGRIGSDCVAVGGIGGRVGGVGGGTGGVAGSEVGDGVAGGRVDVEDVRGDAANVVQGGACIIS